MKKLGTAFMYGLSSFLIMTVNKSVLTVHHFPSAHVLALGQVVSTIVILQILHTFKKIHIPEFTILTLQKLFPLPLFYLGNLIFGLLGTQGLSLPMLTALRRFSILLTLILERLILAKKHENKIVHCVLVMVTGSLIAASNDLAFSLAGYIYVMINNLSTASQAVFVRKKLDSNDLGKFGLLYYNALTCFPMILIIIRSRDDFRKVQDFQDLYLPAFQLKFLCSCVMGLVLNYSIYLCTQYNSALVTTVVGCLKNIIITYIGILFPTEDYVFRVELKLLCVGLRAGPLSRLRLRAPERSPAFLSLKK